MIKYLRSGPGSWTSQAHQPQPQWPSSSQSHRRCLTAFIFPLSQLISHPIHRLLGPFSFNPLTLITDMRPFTSALRTTNILVPAPNLNRLFSFHGKPAPVHGGLHLENFFSNIRSYIHMSHSPLRKKKTTTKVQASFHQDQPNTSSSNVAVFTDAACISIGFEDAPAGIGVYFTESDPRNVSEKIQGVIHTKNGAKLTAVIRALQILRNSEFPHKNIEIVTDNFYVAEGTNNWLPGWKYNDWKTLNHMEVQNKDLWITVDQLLDHFKSKLINVHVQFANVQFLHNNPEYRVPYCKACDLAFEGLYSPTILPQLHSTNDYQSKAQDEPLQSLSNQTLRSSQYGRTSSHSSFIQTTVIYTDGACVNNGQLRAKAGVGVYFAPKDPRNVSEPLPGDIQTNNRAELTAVIRAMEIINNQSHSLSGHKFDIVTDSKYVSKGIDEWLISWKKNGWKTASKGQVKNVDLWKKVDAFISEFSKQGAHVQISWVKGHNGDIGNEMADKLAFAATSISKPPALDKNLRTKKTLGDSHLADEHPQKASSRSGNGSRKIKIHTKGDLRRIVSDPEIDGWILPGGHSWVGVGISINSSMGDPKNFYVVLKDTGSSQQRADLLAASKGLEYILGSRTESERLDTIEIHCGNRQVVNYITSWAENWKANGFVPPVTNADLWASLYGYLDQLSKKGVHVIFNDASANDLNDSDAVRARALARYAGLVETSNKSR